MKKRFISILLSLILIASIFPFPTAFAESLEIVTSDFIEDVNPMTSVPDGYVGIYTTEELSNIRNGVSDKYILMADLDLSEFNSWEPIDSFSGTFDGNGHTISNLHISATSEDELNRYGLFSYVTYATITNLKLSNVQITGNFDGPDSSAAFYIGTVVGSASVNCTIQNCVVTNAEISVPALNSITGDRFYIGGIVGDIAYDSLVGLCYSGANINITVGGNTSDTSTYAGGIAGNSTRSDLYRCYNASTIEVKYQVEGSRPSYSTIIGGIVGDIAYVNGANDGPTTVKECVNTGDIIVDVQTAGHHYTGGIVGTLGYSANVENSYNTGSIDVDVTASTTASGWGINLVGGIAGDSQLTSSLIECFNYSEIVSQSNGAGSEFISALGGLIGESDGTTLNNCYYQNSYQGIGLDQNETDLSSTTALADTNFINESSFVGFDFASTWIMGTRYPVLRYITVFPDGETFSLSYNLNGGNGNIPSSTNYAAGTEVTLTSDIPTYEGYTFSGWSDGTTTYQPGDIFTMPEHNVTLTAMWSSNPANDQMAYVQWLTRNSLTYANEETKATIENAIYNLLFKAQYRPQSSRIPGDTMEFGGSLSVNRTWPIQNLDYQNNTEARKSKRITDSVLGTIKIPESGGCLSYAHFASIYTFGTSGEGTPCIDLSADGIKEYLQKYADPCEQIRYNWHSIVYLGEDDSEDGFYYISYNGGAKRVTSNGITYIDNSDYRNSIFVEYVSYKDFAKRINGYLKVWDVNDGAYSLNTALDIATLREKNGVTRNVVIIECPVEATIRLGDELLDSRTPRAASFGSVERIDNKLIFTLDYSEEYEVDIIGTGEGTMILTVEYYADETLVDRRVFVAVPILEDTAISTDGFDALGTLVLYCTTSDGNEETWGAGINETVYGPDASYSSLYNDCGEFEDESEPDPVPTPNPDDDTTPSRPSSSNNSTTYIISVDAGRNGDVTVSPSRASYGDTVTITVDPDNGYELDELIVTDAGGDEISVRSRGDGRYTFTMPRGRVTVEATFVAISEEPETLPFVDVPTGAYYYDAVAWAVENGVTGGTSATTFSPDDACTRAQMVTFLWRAAGSPEPETTVNPFADVSASAYYYDAVLWAVERGITNGTSATTFSPDATVTRGQTVTFLWRNAGSPAASGNSFADVASDAYYTTAVVWAAREGITSGTSATTFGPDDACTRAQIVTFLWRYLV